MTSVARCALIAGLFVCSGGCSRSATEPEAVAIEFGYSSLGPGDPMSVAPLPSGIQVSAWMRTPCEPYDASAAAERRGRSVTLTVTGRTEPTCLHDVIGSLGYSARLTGLSPATYRLLVVHHYADGSLPDTTLFNLDVVVP